MALSWFFINKKWGYDLCFSHYWLTKAFVGNWQNYGLPQWLSGKESTCCRILRRCGFHPWVRQISWRRKWQSTPVFLPGKSDGQRSLTGSNPLGLKESDTTEANRACSYEPGWTIQQSCIRVDLVPYKSWVSWLSCSGT